MKHLAFLILTALGCIIGTRVGAAPATPRFLLPVTGKVQPSPSPGMQKLLRAVEERHLTECLSVALSGGDLAELQAREDKLEVFHVFAPKESTDMFHHALILEPGTETFWILRSGGIAGTFDLYRGEQIDNVHC